MFAAAPSCVCNAANNCISKLLLSQFSFTCRPSARSARIVANSNCSDASAEGTSDVETSSYPHTSSSSSSSSIDKDLKKALHSCKMLVNTDMYWNKVTTPYLLVLGQLEGDGIWINSAARGLDSKGRLVPSSGLEYLRFYQKEVTNSISIKNKTVVVQKTAATFSPRSSTTSKNPAVPGTALYTIFEVQGYASTILGGALSFNLVFPSDEPDIWRLMGMRSIWMFTIPSLRARDCSKKEKEALNYLFLLIPLLNVLLPFMWKSFAVVWSADTIAFFMMYAWKLGWLEKTE